ncbi:hypothetical protein [Alienimonas californiensis]|uniref:Uncharacterized protein n=1 Tax=Alienimonas californiensis TaxID=2527989 RepID=A0A517P8S6_9PLAN|nr:hypothetical protein [Alienimonas californiensis]QDT15776.1 hypothetical protein CA12_18700 [Alienimonas californiensis]
MSAPPVLLALLLCSAGPEAGDADLGADTLIAPDPAVAAILARWEAATADRVPVSEAEKAADRLQFPNATVEHLGLTAALSGPIDADQLASQYEWTLSERRFPRHRFVYRSLSATPRDPLAKAFTPSLLVFLAEDGTPGSVYSPTDNGKSRWESFLPGVTLVVANASLRAKADAHAVVRAQNVEPESPDARRSPVRTAEYVKPAGDGPIWKLERRLKKTPATRLVNNRQPLTAPRPR